MYYVYVLKSYKWRKLYIGYTNNLRRRLREHNDQENVSTRYGIPWKLIKYSSEEAWKERG